MLRNRKSLFNVLESLSERAWLCDLVTNQFRISSTFWEELGYYPGLPQPLTREAVQKLLHPTDARLAAEEVELHLISEKPFELECRVRAPVGEWRFVRVRGCVTEWSKNGQPAAIGGILTDLTNQVVGARAQHRAEETVATLSRREREVLACLLAGAANKNIAHGLGLSQRTVEGYRARLMDKLDLKSVGELVQLALAAGVAPGDDVSCGQITKIGVRKASSEGQSLL